MQPAQEYYALPAVSQSSLKTFIRSPVEYHWEHILKNKAGAGTRSMSLGSLTHCMLLEPDKLDEQYHQYLEGGRPEPDKTMASTKNKAWKATLEAFCEVLGKNLVASNMWAQADAMTQAFCAHTLASDLLFWQKEGWTVLTEQGILWKSPVADLPLKSKLDRILFNQELGICKVLDYKTSSASNMTEFGWSVKKYGYDIQAAFYADAVTAYLQDNFPGTTFDVQVFFIPQKSAVPYQVLGVCQLDAGTLALARSKYQRALCELQDCLRTNSWESPSVELLTLCQDIPVQLPFDDPLFV